MEILKNFFAGLKERLSSPFFISLFIGLVLSNYRIVVPILFYKHEDLWLDNYWTYIDLIQHLNDTDQIFFWEPLFYAVVFSILYPVFNAISEYFQGRIVAIKDQKTYAAIGPLKAVSVEDHKKEVQKLEEEKAEYARLIQVQGATEAKNIELEGSLDLATGNVNRLEETIEALEKQISTAHEARVQAENMLKEETDKLILAKEDKGNAEARLERVLLRNSELENRVVDLENDNASHRQQQRSDRKAHQVLIDQVGTLKKEAQNYFSATGILTDRGVSIDNILKDEKRLRGELAFYFNRLKEIEEISDQQNSN